MKNGKIPLDKDFEKVAVPIYKAVPWSQSEKNEFSSLAKQYERDFKAIAERIGTRS